MLEADEPTRAEDEGLVAYALARGDGGGVDGYVDLGVRVVVLLARGGSQWRLRKLEYVESHRPALSMKQKM